MWRWLAALRRDKSAGSRGEAIAARHLKQQRYRILARNLRNRFGEIDLLALAPDGRTVVIVEVKAAERSETAGDSTNPRPEQHVNTAKQRKLTALAGQLVRRYRLQDHPIRFDVIGVDLPAIDHRTSDPVIRHHVAAFEARW